jgi:quercetin dioxygenase-like cupin family protein
LGLKPSPSPEWGRARLRDAKSLKPVKPIRLLEAVQEMKVRRLREEPGEPEREEGSSGVNSVDLMLKREDIAGFSSRILRIEPGGHTALHGHEREHVVVVLRGRCRAETGTDVADVGEGCIVSIPPGEPHRFSNPGKERLALLIMNLFPKETQKPEPTEESKPEVP